MNRLTQFKNKISAQRNAARERSQEAKMNKLLGQKAANDKKLQEVRELEAAAKLQRQTDNLKQRSKAAKKSIRAAKLAPIKNAFEKAKAITGKSPLAKPSGKGSNTNPLLGGSNDFMKQFSSNTQPKSAVKLRKKKVKIITYE